MIKYPPIFKEAITQIPPSELRNIFEQLRQQEFNRIYAADSNDQLTDIRSRVRLLNELENVFSTVK